MLKRSVLIFVLMLLLLAGVTSVEPREASAGFDLETVRAETEAETDSLTAADFFGPKFDGAEENRVLSADDFPLNDTLDKETGPATLDPTAGPTGGLAQATIPASQVDCKRTIYADVVALDQPFYYNRLGALNANGMMYALKSDVVVEADPNVGLANVSGDNGKVLTDPTLSSSLTDLAGQVALRPDKRPRPIVLRANEGDCLEITFTNLLDPRDSHIFNLPADFPTGSLPILNLPDPDVGPQIDDQPHTREASIHIDGMFLVNGNGINSDASFVGQNPTPGANSGLVVPGQSTTYRYFAHPDYLGAHLMYSMGSTLGAEGAGGTRAFGLFGAVNEQPAGSLWYRSQLTREEMDMAASAWTCTLCDGTDWGASPGNMPQGEPGAWKVRTTPDGHPILNYDAVYPASAPYGKAGLPILNMLDGNPDTGGELVHTDLNAIISGRQADGSWNPSPWPANEDLGPNRNRAFREFTVVFHDEATGVQAFPAFYNDPALSHTLHGVVDGFPINYGSGGIGSEIIANRLGVGPMWDCAECKYEEFFLTSTTVGDPAMIVDIPANFGVDGGDPWVGPKATEALYPDDPSNVHHSYLNDRVIFRNLHAGPKEHHIFHLHAHQWFFNENEPGSNYHDSQAVGPGSAYTYEIAYGGSGNRNKTVGDSIFHCHFYPHFAQGMWELWRTHDVFEQGTVLDPSDNPASGRPATGARALPDGEISAGTPIPGLVPMPGYAMPPMPFDKATVVPGEMVEVKDGPGQTPYWAPGSSQFDADGNGKADVDEHWATTPAGFPGFPFYLPAKLGHRPPTPALDMMVDFDGDGVPDTREDGTLRADGGLPRHIVTSGIAESDIEAYTTRWDFNKILHGAAAKQVPEGGTPAELQAMEFHAQRWHPSHRFYLDGKTESGDFETNGLDGVPGAPYADPCRGDDGGSISVNRTYKGANIEMDVTLNKVGWHFPQQRFQALWEDVDPLLNGTKAPEPLVMRLNSKDCAEFWHTNLVPNVYELDDYQVRTPTDIIGQHIHLVKFDVMSADGAANGWNYEDGTLSPQEVVERIEAFNHGGGFEKLNNDGSTITVKELKPAEHPFFGLSGKDANGDGFDDWLGARTTIQRWYADPLLERSWDGGLGTVFTHDHYGPSTHQQVGLYSTVLIEPIDSTWRDPETGVTMGDRHDGGPTSWRADILIPYLVDLDGDNEKDDDASHREFFLEFADFQHAYQAGGGKLGSQDNGAGKQIPSYADFFNAVNPSSRQEPPKERLADLFWFPNECPGGGPRPCPEAISADDPGTYVVNYRNEPVGLRVYDPNTKSQAAGDAGDLALAFQSRTDRAIPALNTKYGALDKYDPLTLAVKDGDPATPLLRVYQGDRVRVRTQVGAHEEEHTITFHGLKWKQEPFNPDSSWRNTQFGGISEYFNLDVPISDNTQSKTEHVDYFYTMGAQVDDLWNGIWGIMRAYDRLQDGKNNTLLTLPNNIVAKPGKGKNASPGGPKVTNLGDFGQACPKDQTVAPLRTYDVVAVRAADVLAEGWLVYNDRDTTVKPHPDSVESGNLQKGKGPLVDPTALMYVLAEDLDPDTGMLLPWVKPEPLILRARAGECIKINLENRLPADAQGLASWDMPGFNALPPVVFKEEVANNGVNGFVTFNANHIVPSNKVGIIPQLVHGPAQKLGIAVGHEEGGLVGPDLDGIDNEDNKESFEWYAGHIEIKRDADGITLVPQPVEFGAINLMPSDKIKGSNKGLVGALIVEPQNASWKTDPGTRASATVDKGDGNEFREFVTIFQDDINLRYGGDATYVGGPDCKDPGKLKTMACAVANIAGEGPGTPEDSQDTGQKAINYGSEPLWYRLGVPPNSPFGGGPGTLRDLQTARVFSNDQVGGEPQTPVFVTSPVGDPPGQDGKDKARVRLLQPGGHARGHVYTLHGHAWQRVPTQNKGSVLGENPDSWWIGTQEGFNPSSHWDLLLNPGGPENVVGDYLYRDQASFGSLQGLWGIFRYNRSKVMPGVDLFTTTEDTPLEISIAGLLANDLDLDGDGQLSITAVAETSVMAAAGGANVVNNGNQTLTYTPAPNFNGLDHFTYMVNDGQDGETSGTVYVKVTPVNKAPVAYNDPEAGADLVENPIGYPVDEDTTLTVLAATGVLTNDVDLDGDALTAVLVTSTANGDLTLNADGSFVYTPTLNFNGSDTFTYVASDTLAYSNEATAVITVNPTNDAPVATDASYLIPAGNLSISGNLLDNASDMDGDALTLGTPIGETLLPSGTLTVDVGGVFTFTPTSLATAGSESFEYTANDGQVDSNAATVTISWGQANQAPTAAFDPPSCNYLDCSFDASGSIDPEGLPLTYGWNFGDTTSATGSVVDYTYAAAGTYPVTLIVTDTGGLTDTVTQDVTVSEAPPPALHIGSLAGAVTSSGNQWTAAVTVTVHNESDGLADGAVVTGTWSIGSVEVPDGCTMTGGACVITSDPISKKGKDAPNSVTFTVTEVSNADEATYDAAVNEVGNPATIMIAKPE